MEEKKVRGKNKRQVDLGIRDYYDFYKQRSISKDRKPVTFDLYRIILKEANTLIRDSIVYNNEVVKLPYKLGYLGIKKYNVTFDPEKQQFWKVDFNKTKEMGFKVYYEQDYRYKWKWNKFNFNIKGRKYYMFIPCRSASRLIAKALRENPRLDYCEKLI